MERIGKARNMLENKAISEKRTVNENSLSAPPNKVKSLCAGVTGLAVPSVARVLYAGSHFCASTHMHHENVGFRLHKRIS